MPLLHFGEASVVRRLLVALLGAMSEKPGAALSKQERCKR